MMYGMEKTTVYLPEALKAALERTAEAEQRSEADLIREGVALVVERHLVREPLLPLFESGQPDLAEHMDEALDGFGER
jgi:Arc/MetJ-type ribon-helix-helix transcriptional regulator